MVNGTWFVWMFINIFNEITLLNFAIAYNSETYDLGKIENFKNMASLNYESRVITYCFYELFKCKKQTETEFDYIVVTHAKDYQIDDED